MPWSRLGILVFGVLLTQRVQSTALRCETDTQCPKPLVCRLICKRTCRSVCVRLRPTQSKTRLSNAAPQYWQGTQNGFEQSDNIPLQIASYENEPFSTMSDMFVESNMKLSTPVTISEMQVGSKELVTDNNVQQRDEIAIEPIHDVPFRRSRQHQSDVGRLAQVLPLNEGSPRGPPAPALRHQLHTRVPPAPLNLNENSVIDFTEPPRQRITPPNGPLPIPNGPPSPPSQAPPETIQIAVPSIPPPRQGRNFRPAPPLSATLSPWRKTRIPLSVPVNNRPTFRGHIQSSHPLKPPPGIKPENNLDCPPPPICEKNCGVSIDEHGCQGCKCLWISALCRHDSDCPQVGQFCDFGRCECRAGFIHSSIRSGICERSFSDSPSIVPPSLNNFQLNGAKNVHATTEAYKPRPRRSELVAQKPNREERLQWPGPCDSDAECAPNLYCINSDCWHVPEKPLRSFQIEHSDVEIRRAQPKRISDQLFPLSNDYDEKVQEKPQEASPPSILPEDIITAPHTSTIETTTLTTAVKSTITTTNGFITRPAKTKKQPKSKIPLPIETTINDPLPEFDLNPLPSPLTAEQLDKEVESITTIEPQPITEDQLDKEVEPTQMPEFTKPTKTTRTRHTTPSPSTEGWKEMSNEVATESSPPTTEPSIVKNKMAPIFLDYSSRKKKPVRIEAFNAKDRIKDECLRTEDCGPRYVCCAKRFCDLSLNCGNGRFCLPDCRLTKMIHLPGTFQPNGTMIDLVYD